MAERARRLVALERRMWASLGRWVARRPDVPAGGEAFGYARPVAPVLWTFVGLSAVETAAFHLLLPWPAVRLVVDVLSGYGLLWMLGILAAYRMRPHVVGERGLRLRHALFADVTVPWEDVAAVRRRRGPVADGGMVQWEGDALVLAVSGQANLEVVLERPVVLTGDRPATAVRFHADDPAAMERAVHARLGRKIG